MSAWVIGNWKLNPATLQQALVLANDIKEQTTELSNCQIVVAPSTLYTATLATQMHTSHITMAAQDVTAMTADTGAYTGDVSAKQLQDIGVSWVILGHSERREYYAESNALLLQKLQHCQQYHLGVILCVGETEAEYDAGQTQQVLNKQLQVIYDFLAIQAAQEKPTDKLDLQLIIAYEPVWAIGTGKIPTVEVVTQIHAQIRDVLGTMSDYLKSTPIIYGGSVKPENAQVFASSQQIDGVLVGGAALTAESFVAIAQAFAEPN
ncbi:triose-phosphate isomerase [Psychrobacter sp. I-STPA10]|uniref:triose-phosphate isomerase n=1 Tax=Psychrobacter sp. I-STPA10 TaxID=2585769 RepID=UPI001E30358D|nr:triose-phosphate isomerase [Psychrobacter sp. I-STPA10]